MARRSNGERLPGFQLKPVLRKNSPPNNNSKVLVNSLYRKRALSAGFEPTRGDPIGFQVQRLNHSAKTAGRSVLNSDL